MASDGPPGDFIPTRTAEYLQGTAVGVQGQQMLLWAQDLACLLLEERASPCEVLE